MPNRARLASMNMPLRKAWTQEEFFAWAGSQDGRYEFDGFQPVAMTGGSNNHSLIMRALHRALDRRLRGSKCQYLGPDAGLATAGKTIRYPDALVTCSKFSGTAMTIPGVIVAFEILSPSSKETDTVTKVDEYAAVGSILRYVILGSSSAVLTVLDRSGAGRPWTETTLVAGEDVLRMPEIGIEISVAELYEGIDFTGSIEADDS